MKTQGAGPHPGVSDSVGLGGACEVAFLIVSGGADVAGGGPHFENQCSGLSPDGPQSMDGRQLAASPSACVGTVSSEGAGVAERTVKGSALSCSSLQLFAQQLPYLLTHKTHRYK